MLKFEKKMQLKIFRVTFSQFWNFKIYENNYSKYFQFNFHIVELFYQFSKFYLILEVPESGYVLRPQCSSNFLSSPTFQVSDKSAFGKILKKHV